MPSQPTSETISLVRTLLPTEAPTQFGWTDEKITEVLVAHGLSVSQTVRTFWYERVTNTTRYHDKGVPGVTDNLTQIYEHYKEQLAYWDSVIAAEGYSRRPITFGEIESPTGL